MTVRVTTLKGGMAGRYYTEQLPSYYLDGGEPPGRWFGRGARMLGLDGEIDDEAFLAVMAGQHPTTGERLGRRFGEESVRGFDATFSAPKSVSVLFGVGDEQLRREVTEAHDRTVDAVLGWVESRAHTRMRRRGHVVCVDADGIVAGVFRQHTSRKLDPQLHTHAVIANRVRAPDGRWLALDARALKMDQRTLSGLYHAGLRAELTRRLGVAWQPVVNGISEMAGVDGDILAEFSQRTRDVEQRVEVKLARFRTDLDREPTPRERWRLEREAVVDSRPPKTHGTTAVELRAWWRQRVEALGFDVERLVATVIGRQMGLEGVDQETAGRMVDGALEALAGRQSTWRPAEVVRELAATVPTKVTVDAQALVAYLQRLAADDAAARCVDLSPPIPAGATLRRDGRPIGEAATDRALTIQAIVDEEKRLVAWARHRHTRSTAKPVFNARGRLDGAQAEAAAAVAGYGGLELIVGPAGAGKTTMLAAVVADLEAQGRAVFGVAPTAVAAEVLAAETGMAADTVDKLLAEWSHPTRPPDPAYQLPAGATVIVDEAGTASTPKLAELARLADRHRWRVVLVGDPRQFTAVGRGGMFTHLVDTYGATELDRIHRFDHQWERAASIRLRNGDPAVLGDYQRHGRLHHGTATEMEAAVIDHWQQARSSGQSVALMANRAGSVARLNRHAQQHRIAAGDLDPNGLSLQVGEQRLLVGDKVVTRRNQRRLRTDLGVMVKNRDRWTITAIHPDRSLTLTGPTGTVCLPAAYVAEHVELGYAQTSHAAQGRTVDTALLLVDTVVDHRGVYTPLTRGRRANHAYVAADHDHETAVDVLTQALGRDWIDQPAITRRAQSRQAPQDQPRWRSIEAHALEGTEPRRVIQPGQEPEPAEDHASRHRSNDDPIQEPVEEVSVAIDRRRRRVQREPGRPTLGR